MITRKKPWNRVDLPVYSISSQSGNEQNMHMMTYCTAISMQPKRMMCGIYAGTKTLALVRASGEFVLQLLHEDQFRLTTLLGKTSGHQVNKIARLQKRGMIGEWQGYAILNDALAVMHLRVINETNAGDHFAYLCDVIAYKNLRDGNALTTRILSEKGLVRL